MDWTKSNNNAELFQACRNGCLSEAQTMVHVHGAKVNAVDPDTGLTPLHIICSEGHLRMVQWLLEWTAFLSSITTSSMEEDVDAPLVALSVLHLLQAVDSMGNTPLHYACANGRADIIRVVAAAVAADDTTPASWAELLAMKNNVGRTPADWARDKRKSHVARELESVILARKNQNQ